MPGINKCLIIERLGRDPEVKYTPGGDAVCNFSVATSETWKDKNTGEKKEKTEWSNIVAWRRLGEICGEYLSKGSQVYVEGKLQTRSWEKDGVKRYTTEIVADKIEFIGGRVNRDDSNQGSAPARGGQGQPADDDQDIPF